MTDRDFTMVLIPGLACDGAVWAEQIAALDLGDRLYMADHGTADSLETMARQVLAATSGPLVVAGHSMGGRVALEVARLAEDRLRALALLDTGYRALNDGPAGESERESRLRLLAKAEREGMRSMASDWVQNMVHPSRLGDWPLIESILDMFERSSAEKFGCQQRALLQRPDATSVLEHIRCPTLVLCGEQDAWSPPPQHREMAAMVNGSHLVVVPGCGHMAMMERPHAVTRAMRAWLTSAMRAA